MKNAHAQPIESVAKAFSTDIDRGLGEEEAAARLQEYGPNELPEEKKRSVLLLFLKQFHSTLTYILFAAAALSCFVGEYKDAIGILIAVLIDVIFGFVQERRAESAITKLRVMIVQEASVMRNGNLHRIPARDIVPGDVVMLSEGDKIVADARLVEVKDLRMSEASLTGESSPVHKAAGMVGEDTPMADMSDMVWMGTSVVAGNARAVVVETGVRTEFGRIAESLREIERDKTPFELRINRLGKKLGLWAIALSLVVLAAGLLRGFPIGGMFFFAVAMMVSVIPEGLPAVLAVVLAIGVRRMARRNAIVRHVPSVETLGVTDVICTDKTGTLTENKMTVREIATANHDLHVTGEGWHPEGDFVLDGNPIRTSEIGELDMLLKAATLCNRASLEWKGERAGIVGDPTEGALVVMGAKAGLDKRSLRKDYVLIDEIPFSSARKYQAVLEEHTDLSDKRSRYMFVVGAYDVLVKKMGSVMVKGKKCGMDAGLRGQFDRANDRMAGEAMRVICVAYKKVPVGQNAISDDDTEDLTLLGLVAMIDPPRDGVDRAIERCRSAGVRVIMITGDQKATAVAIGREIGLIDGADGQAVLTENDIDDITDEELREKVQDTAIFARVTPKTKLRIVSALQEMDHIVAMTGDGVNDAPALKKASIGISMGISGTDVSREVADMVLADDNFVSIVNAIEEGRTVFQNVKNTTAFLFMTNAGEVVTVLGSLLVGLPLPLLPTQILWMNLVTDGFPDVALATEPTDKNVLNEPPRRKGAPVLTKNIFVLTALTSALMCVGTLVLFSWALKSGDLAYARTVAFTTMAVFQLWNVFNMRSMRESLFTLGLWSNMFVFWGVVASLALQVAVIYIPALSSVFRTVPLGIMEWFIIVAVSSSVFFAVEIYKVFYRRGVIPVAWR